MKPLVCLLWSAVLLSSTLWADTAEALVAPSTPPPARLVEIVQAAAERGLLTPELDRELSGLVLEKMGGLPALPAPAAASPAAPPPEWTRLNLHVIYLLVPDVAALPETWLPAVAAETAGARDAWVLDLRFTGGTAFADANRAAAFFKNRPPPVVLIGPETAGAGEQLAAQLRQGGATLVGQPTSGRLRELRPFPTADGGGFLLPVPVPLPAGERAPAPLRPDVAVEGAPPPRRLAQGLTPDRFRAMPERDPALRRAVDLASTLLALEPGLEPAR